MPGPSGEGLSPIYNEDGSADLSQAEQTFTEKPKTEKPKKQGLLEKRFPFDPGRRKALITAAKVGGAVAVGGLAAASGLLREEPKVDVTKETDIAVKAIKKRNQQDNAREAAGLGTTEADIAVQAEENAENFNK